MKTTQTSKRKWRNFLLDKRFQLKYTLAVVLVSSVISLVMGYFLYQFYDDIHRSNQELFSAHGELYKTQLENSKLIHLSELDLGQEFAEELRRKDEAQRARYEKIEKSNALNLQNNRNVLIFLAISLGGLVRSPVLAMGSRSGIAPLGFGRRTSNPISACFLSLAVIRSRSSREGATPIVPMNGAPGIRTSGKSLEVAKPSAISQRTRKGSLKMSGLW